MITHPGQVGQQERKWAWIAGGIAVMLVVFAAWPTGDPAPADESRPAASVAKSGTVNVVYEVDGSAIEASVTMATPTGTQQVDANARLGGDDLLSFTVEPGEFLYISAQNQNELGTIACRIIVDGVVIAENQSTASYGIASCEGSAR